MKIPAISPRTAVVVLLLASLVLGLYLRTLGHDFVNLDDDRYVYDNPHLAEGLNSGSLAWALTSDYEAVWIPATWTSFLIDRTLHGPEARGFHLTNLILHLSNVMLLLLLLFRLSGGFWRSALVAGLFAVHPLAVEPVAWVTGRKDLLALCFMLLALLVHLRQIRRPHLVNLVMVFDLSILAMMAKPVAVVLPVLMLLVDLLGPQIERRPLRRVLLEKVPLLAAAVAVALVTLHAATSSSYGQPETIPWLDRLGRACVFLVSYLEKLVWPQGLCAVYPIGTEAFPLARVVSSAALLALISAVVWRRRNTRGLLTLGWAWFLVGVLPAVDLVQGGQQLLSDRYLYLPGIGLMMMIAWGLGWIAQRRPHLRLPVTLLSVAALVTLTAVAWFQVRHWQDGEAAWLRALDVTSDNHLAHTSLAVFLDNAGRGQEALVHARTAVEIKPTANGHYNLGNILQDQGLRAEARQQFALAVRLRDTFTEAHNNLGILLGQEGQLEEAARAFRQALDTDPDFAQAHYNLGLILLLQNDIQGARREFGETLRLDPGHRWAREELDRLDRAGG